MLSYEPNDILIGLREPLLLLEAAAQLGGGQGGGGGGGRGGPAGNPVIDTQAVAIVASGGGGGRQEPVGVGQVPRGRRRGGRLPVLRRQAGELRGLALAPAAPAAASSRPVGLHAAAADQTVAAAPLRGGRGGRRQSHHHHHGGGGGGRRGRGGEACSAGRGPGLSCSLRRRGSGLLPRGRGGSAGVRVGGGGSGGQSFLAERGRGGRPAGRGGGRWGGRRGRRRTGPFPPPPEVLAARPGDSRTLGGAGPKLEPRRRRRRRRRRRQQPPRCSVRAALLPGVLILPQLLPNGVRALASQEMPILPSSLTSGSRYGTYRGLSPSTCVSGSRGKTVVVKARAAGGPAPGGM